MRFADFIVFEAIRPNLMAADKDEAIQEMICALVDAGRIDKLDEESSVQAILKREWLGSTGIGRGIAIPHVKHPCVEQLIGTVAISPKGIEFNSLDGEAVRLIFLLISPQDRPGDHLRALEQISRLMRWNAEYWRLLMETQTRQGVWQLLNEIDDMSK